MLKTKNLRWTKNHFSNSILSARLISILDFVFALPDVTKTGFQVPELAGRQRVTKSLGDQNSEATS
jgi:hypothetical protein